MINHHKQNNAKTIASAFRWVASYRKKLKKTEQVKSGDNLGFKSPRKKRNMKENKANEIITT